MNGLVETHRSFVNTWECDENEHMNVQFYLKRFDEAARFFSAMSGGGLDAPLPRVRLVRYHGELHAGAMTRITSGHVADGQYAGCAVHVMENTETGTLSATTLDSPAGAATGHDLQETRVPLALPRSLDLEPAAPLDAESMIAAGGLVTHRCIVQPAECDAAGTMLQQFHVARFTDGAPHVWEHAGIGIAWLRARNYGRVALEMKLTHHRPARAGDGLVQYSLPSAARGKTFRLRHEIVRLADGAPVTTGEVVAVILDLSTRRTVPLPEMAGVGG